MNPPNEVAERSYRGESASERRSARAGRLTGALLDLVQEHGIGALTVGLVCERAGVSKRHFYEQYDNLDSLAVEVLESSLAAVSAHIAATPYEPVDDAVGGLIAAAVEAILATFDDARMAKLYLEAAGNRGLRDSKDRAVAQFVDSILEALTGSSSPDPRAKMTAHLLIAGASEVVAKWLDGEVALSRRGVAACLVALGSDAARRIRANDFEVLAVGPQS
ncbi:TetR/AcrR family transcriptional regulator [Rhodococcus sp. IEGM 1381]|uniref:TetR/AcrR family transcriptional regulator n=1 Tax=Rhodococcus sp. IEGM 1381 TaxID=3047085 RepID=UPI0024B790EA|nr:TetR/AcrR family transcriptional regulator [Rhodococcus sp. IEGM 1381]MDI9894505.1 TetR/AcrR family transcriptional regulator [Rhodococcus sp. IEGM 1381]